MVAVLKGAAVGAILCLALLPAPAKAQETLERIQNDVAGIVRATKSAVVSIEDERLYLKVDGVDIGETVAQALKEAEKELQRTTHRANAAEDGSTKGEASRKEKLEAAKHLSELREHMSGLREQLKNNIGGRLNFTVDDAPRSGTGFSIGDGYVVTTA